MKTKNGKKERICFQERSFALSGQNVADMQRQYFVFSGGTPAYPYTQHYISRSVQEGNSSLHGSHAGVHEVRKRDVFPLQAIMEGGGAAPHFRAGVRLAYGHMFDTRRNAGHTEQGHQSAVGSLNGKAYGGAPFCEFVER